MPFTHLILLTNDVSFGVDGVERMLSYPYEFVAAVPPMQGHAYVWAQIEESIKLIDAAAKRENNKTQRRADLLKSLVTLKGYHDNSNGAMPLLSDELKTVTAVQHVHPGFWVKTCGFFRIRLRKRGFSPFYFVYDWKIRETRPNWLF